MTVPRRELERSPTPPSVYVRRIAKERDLTQDKLAEALGVSRLTVNQLVNNKRAVTPEMALRLERLTGISAQQWLALQQNYDLWHLRNEKQAELEKVRAIPAQGSEPEAFNVCS